KDGIRDRNVTVVHTCSLPILVSSILIMFLNPSNISLKYPYSFMLNPPVIYVVTVLNCVSYGFYYTINGVISTRLQKLRFFCRITPKKIKNNSFFFLYILFIYFLLNSIKSSVLSVLLIKIGRASCRERG